jgi:23S rRNA pseudouridine2605 synthase
MRINKYIALATGMSRRAADAAIAEGKILVNNLPVQQGKDISNTDVVYLNGKVLTLPESFTTILLHKPIGYVCSRDGQGSKTIYDLLPPNLHSLKPIGRLDKDSSGLLLLTNNGDLAQELSHPKQQKTKIYEITLDKPLSTFDWQSIHEQGIQLEDGPSKLFLERLEPLNDKHWQVTMHEGRNRQIRRTFEAIGYEVTHLHRTHFGDYSLQNLPSGQFVRI